MKGKGIEMKYNLSECDWEIKGYYPWVPCKDKSMETGKELMGITPWIKACVPGGVHYDLYRAGLITDPYKDLDSLKAEWVEKRWWVYRTRIEATKLGGKYQFLVFKGIDYQTRIYINGKECLRHEGMYETITIDISDEISIGKDVELKVLLMGVPDEMGQIGMTSQTFTQKSRFNYKWDFSTRLVNQGIWDECYVECLEDAALYDVYITTDYSQEMGYISLEANVEEYGYGNLKYEVDAVLEKDGRRIEKTFLIKNNRVLGEFTVENPMLWYPNGYGSQELYQVTLLLRTGDRILYTTEYQVGIRSLQYRINEESPENALPYTFCVNEERIYIKGVNMTPLDHIYGNVTAAHYEHMVKLMKNMNVNMVRIWGGGLIEKDIFYTLCDQYGILIWQEFIQSSSGIDNVASKRPEFLNLLRKTAETAVLRHRSHTALAVWSGGNELTDEDYIPAGYDDSNIAMLKEIVQHYDSQRLFLPTSASGPNEFVNRDKNVSHDIHGNWNYMGNPVHYDLYSGSDSLFHSEFGTEGMCSTRSLNKFVSEKYQTLEPAEENMVYRHHGEWWCTYERDQKLFGDRMDIEQMSKCSQWLQAEGLRFILEANRRRKFHNSGSIIWQINEPWPNVYCTSLVDYYMEPKMAYYWSRKAFSDLSVSLDYSKLDYCVGEIFRAGIFVSKDSREKDMGYHLDWKVMDMGGRTVNEGKAEGLADCGRTVKARDMEFALPDLLEGMFVVKLRIEMGGKISENAYYFGCGQDAVYESALRMKSGKLAVEELPEEDGKLCFRLRAEGDVPILHVYPYCEQDYDLICDNSYITLFPGELADITIQYSPRFESGFLNCEMQKDKMEHPDIRFSYFNQ